MINSRKLQITGLSMLSLVGSGCTDKNGSIENGVRPNIVLFLADDIGAECFGCMGGVSYDTHISILWLKSRCFSRICMPNLLVLLLVYSL